MFSFEYLQNQIDEKLHGDASRFDELWDLIPDFAGTLRKFDLNNEWLNWSEKTYDGWYCVTLPDGRYEVYYKERGIKFRSYFFVDERQAFRHLLTASGTVRV